MTKKSKTVEIPVAALEAILAELKAVVVLAKKQSHVATHRQLIKALTAPKKRRAQKATPAVMRTTIPPPTPQPQGAVPAPNPLK
jgi:uncharacterized coiled-coil protein SlyX